MLDDEEPGGLKGEFEGAVGEDGEGDDRDDEDDAP